MPGALLILSFIMAARRIARVGKLPAKDNDKERNKAKAKDEIDDGVPQVFKDMLAEDQAASYPQVGTRSVKRRRVGERLVHVQMPQEPPADFSEDEASYFSGESSLGQRSTQIIEDLDRDSDEEDFEWEEVDVATAADFMPKNVTSKPAEDRPLSISLARPESSIRTVRRRVRKPVSSAEKMARLDVHKVHLLCLIFHAYQRNHWCNDDIVQRTLRKGLRISPKILGKLFPDPSKVIQYQRSKLLKEALIDLSETWKTMFTINLYGQRRAFWDSNLPSNHMLESFSSLSDFREKAKLYKGSADYGAQLFCALLRGLGLETRLICSLQPLPFASSAANVPLASAPSVSTIYAIDSDDDHYEEDVPHMPAPKPRRIARLGRGRRAAATSDLGVIPGSIFDGSRAIPRPRHPIFWVEVFDEAYQNWISVDPIATGHVAKPLSLEPALNDPENLLSYVIAFEDDNTAREVTRRYTKAYNAKTRKLRVECTDYGIPWYKKALRLFRRRRKKDRDLVEEAYFIQRDIQEGMPKNIEDFKGHPVYVLERHLYRDEALHPKREVGKVGHNAKAANLSNLESVYRREDVQKVKSADKWFRQGRRIKETEQALKYVKARRRRELFEDVETAEESEEANVGLFAHFQTELFIPPPVTLSGLVPRNSFGNLDVYTRSMIPAGAVHVKSKHARQAARILGIDHVDAVTGFNFRGRHGTAVVNGVIVAAKYSDAMIAVLDGMAYTREKEETDARQTKSLDLWRKFIIGLQIVESVKQYRKEGEATSDEDDVDGDDDDGMQLHLDTKAELSRLHNVPDTKPFAMSLLPEIGDFEIVESIHKMPGLSAAPEVNLQDDDVSSLFDAVEPGGFLCEDGGKNETAEFPIMSETGEGGFIKEETGPMIESRISAKEAESCDGNDGGSFDKVATIAPEDHYTAMENAKRLDGSPNQELDDLRGFSDAQKHVSLSKKVKSSEDSDSQSLLSHDPEDDEVDPDWL